MLTLYADFGYPCCHLAGHAVDLLEAAGVAVDWRAVERDPRLSTSPRTITAEERAVLADEPAAEEVLGAGEDPASTAPGTVPNTGAAVAGYAEAYGTGVADDVRRLLLEAHWVDRVNIGDPEVLRRLLVGPILRGRSGSSALQRFGFAVSVNRGPVTTSAWRRIREWRDEWQRLAAGDLPVLVAGDGATVAGPAAVVGRLAKLVRESGRLDPPALPDSARFPQMPLRPGKQWVSMVGGQWAYAWMGR